MGPKSESYTFNQLKELLQMHENTLLNVFSSTIDRLDKKIDILKEEENSKIKKELTDLRESVRYHSDNVDEVNKKLEDIDKRIEGIKLDETTEDFVTKIKKKLADLEDCSRRNNLRFHGFQEETNKTWEEGESIITNFVKEKLGIVEDILIERAHRTGKIQRHDGTRNRKRTIAVKFLNFKDKSRILYTFREKKLRKEKVFVNEDSSEETASIRKGLLQKAKDLRSQNKVAKIVHDRLIVYKKVRGNDISEAQGNP